MSARRNQKPVDELPLFRAPLRPVAVRLSGVIDSWLDYSRNMHGDRKREFLIDCLARVRRAGGDYQGLERRDLAVAERRVEWAIGAAMESGR